MPTKTKATGGNATAKKKAPAKKRARKPEPKPLELIVDPVEQHVYDRQEQIHKALAKVDEKLSALESEQSGPNYLEARLMFNSFQYSTPFRALIGLAAE